MTLVTQLTELAAPWASLYNDSTVISTAVTFTHLAGMLLGGGCAVAADRMTLRRLRVGTPPDAGHLADLHAVHATVIIGLGLSFISGLLMLGADVETLLPSKVFWVKLGVVGILLLNGAIMKRAEGHLRAGATEPDPIIRRLRVTSWLSLSLWFGAALVGTMLTSA